MVSYIGSLIFQLVMSLVIFFGILSIGRNAFTLLFSGSQSTLTFSNVKVLVYCFALGFIGFCVFWFVMGLMGWLTLPHVYLVFGIFVVAIVAQRSYHHDWVIRFCRVLSMLWKQGSYARWLIVICVCSLFSVWIRCWSAFVDGDSLVYHLFLPKQFVLQGKLFGLPFSEHAYWPLMAEVSFIPAEIVGSSYLSKMLSFLMFALLALIASFLTHRCPGNSETSLWVAAIVLTTPYLFYHAASTYSDLFFSFYLLAALLILQEDLAFHRSRVSVYFTAGLFMGASIAAKYLGLFGVFAIACVTLVRLFMRRVPDKIKLLCSLMLGFSITGFPFYVRAYIARGNPFFPFLQKFFETDYGWSSSVANAAAWSGSSTASMSGRGQGVLEFLMLPWNLTFHPADFLGDKIGFVYLAIMIGLISALRRNLFLVLYCLMYTLLWFISGQATRYLTPVFPIVAAMGAYGLRLGEQHRGVTLKLFKIVVIMFLILQTAWACYLVPKEFIKAKDSLRLREFAQRVSAAVDNPEAKVLVIGESRVYYFNFIPIREKPFRHFTKYPDRDSFELLKVLDRENILRIFIITRSQETDVHEHAEQLSQLIAQGFFKAVFQMPWMENNSIATLYLRTEALSHTTFENRPVNGIAK